MTSMVKEIQQDGGDGDMRATLDGPVKDGLLNRGLKNKKEPIPRGARKEYRTKSPCKGPAAGQAEERQWGGRGSWPWVPPPLSVTCPSDCPSGHAQLTPPASGWQPCLGTELYLDATLLSVDLEHTVSF